MLGCCVGGIAGCALAAGSREDDFMNPALSYVRRVAAQFGERPEVVAVALGGSRGSGVEDACSDFDLYVYSTSEVPLDFRLSLAGDGAELDNRFWEPGDEWIDGATQARMDVMYRTPAWIENQLDRVLVRHEASLGYSTCFWYNVLHSEPLSDGGGWYRKLQERARVPFPEPLREAILTRNLAVVGRNQSSYRRQIEVALERGDEVALQHRVTALLASVFDLWFAMERQPHPGEKRLLSHLPGEWASAVRSVLRASPATMMESIDGLVARVERDTRPRTRS